MTGRPSNSCTCVTVKEYKLGFLKMTLKIQKKMERRTINQHCSVDCLDAYLDKK